MLEESAHGSLVAGSAREIPPATGFSSNVSALPSPLFVADLFWLTAGELQEYVHASGLAQRRAEEQGINFVIAELHGLLLMCCGNFCLMAVETPSWGAWRDAERSPRYQ